MPRPRAGADEAGRLGDAALPHRLCDRGGPRPGAGHLVGLAPGPSIALAVVLAFLFGYALTVWPLLRSGLSLGSAVKIALAADTLSILTMEIVDNAIILAVPGAMEAGLASPLFWGTLAVALAVAFVVTVPVNRALIARGKGHAVVHAHH